MSGLNGVPGNKDWTNLNGGPVNVRVEVEI